MVAIFWQVPRIPISAMIKPRTAGEQRTFGWLRLMKAEMYFGIRDMVGVRMIIARASSPLQMEIIFFMVHRPPRQMGIKPRGRKDTMIFGS